MSAAMFPSAAARSPFLGHLPLLGMTPPTHMVPEQFSKWMSVPPPSLVRSDTLGSTGDTPSTSASCSPVNSPSTAWSDVIDMSSANRSAFPFDNVAAGVGQASAESTGSTLNELARSLEGLSLQAGVGGATAAISSADLRHDSPPSSPECGSSGRAMRLPVFSKLASSGQ